MKKLVCLGTLILIFSVSFSQSSTFGDFILETDYGARLYRSNHKSPDDLINSIKNLCRGNSIFIDFWATWCGPCLKEMPHFNNLSSEVKDLPVKFIYICTTSGTTQENWINKIVTLKQSGIHILTDDALLVKTAVSFDVGVFPGYVFIDGNGNYLREAISQDGNKIIETLKARIIKSNH